MEEKWLQIYQPNKSYEENLKLLTMDFERLWVNCKPSPIGELEDNYQLFGVIGEGAFGTVVVCQSKVTSHVVAVKILLKEQIIERNQVSHVIYERKILDCVCFPFLIYLEFSLKNNSCLYLGLPFIQGGELFTYHRESVQFKEDEAKFYAAQVLLAIDYLHHLNVLYRDLKPENLLIDVQGYIKLTDLGFAKKVETRTYTFCGTPEYFSPEMVQNQAYGKSVDWWAFGVLLYEFVAGHSPFVEINTLLMFERITSAKYTTPYFFSNELKDLIHHLLQVNVSRRFGCMKNASKDIKNHKWFKNLNWFSILNKQEDPFHLPIVKRSNIKGFTHSHKEKLKKKKVDKYREEFKNF